MDSLRHEVDTLNRAIAALAAQYEQTAQQIQQLAETTAASIDELSAAMLHSCLLQSATSRLQTLQSERRASHLQVSFAPPDKVNAIMQDLHRINAEISTQQAAVLQAQESLAAQTTAASNAELSAFMLNSSLLQSAMSRLEALQSDRRASRLLLLSAPLDKANVIVQDLRHINAEISAQRTAVSLAQESLAAAQLKLTSHFTRGSDPV